jgi:alkylated DNA repair dioxygenase AlkB
MRAKKISDPVELPEGFLYEDNFLSESEEGELLRRIEAVQFAPYEFRGYKARRQVASFGTNYGALAPKGDAEARPIPDFLAAIRDRAAAFAGLAADEIVQAMITEYSPGTPIGWHRDRPQFGTIVGISLASSCRMRLKPYQGEGKIISKVLEPRSIYAMQGVARSEFLHSIPAVEKLRYSITFRTLAKSWAKKTDVHVA